MDKLNKLILIIGPVILIGVVFLLAFYNLKENPQVNKKNNLTPTTIITAGITRPILLTPTTIEPTLDPQIAILAITNYQQMEDNDRKNDPDIFLYNQLPFENSDFKMEGKWLDDGSFQFIVTSYGKTGAQLKTIVENWLLSLKLTQTQITTLKIKYP